MSGRWTQEWVEPSADRKPWGWLWRWSRTVVHHSPPDGSGLMPCCGRTPFERMHDRMTLDPALVTCRVAREDARP